MGVGFISSYFAHSSGDASKSHVEGFGTIALQTCCHAEGSGTIAGANNQHVQGRNNAVSLSGTDLFIIGNGNSRAARSNCFRATFTGVYASGSYNSSGANYAELFEWLYGNPENIN